LFCFFVAEADGPHGPRNGRATALKPWARFRRHRRRRKCPTEHMTRPVFLALPRTRLRLDGGNRGRRGKTWSGAAPPHETLVFASSLVIPSCLPKNAVESSQWGWLPSSPLRLCPRLWRTIDDLRLRAIDDLWPRIVPCLRARVACRASGTRMFCLSRSAAKYSCRPWHRANFANASEIRTIRTVTAVGCPCCRLLIHFCSVLSGVKISWSVDWFHIPKPPDCATTKETLDRCRLFFRNSCP